MISKYTEQINIEFWLNWKQGDIPADLLIVADVDNDQEIILEELIIGENKDVELYVNFENLKNHTLQNIENGLIGFNLIDTTDR